MHSLNTQLSIFIFIQRFIQLSDDETSDLTGSVVTTGVMQYAGLHCWRGSGGIDYTYSTNFEYSNEHLLAQRMGLATTIMGATCWGLYFLSGCIRFPSFLWLGISFILLATCICQGIMFKFFDTSQCESTDCTLATSSKCGIAACIFWGISSFMTCGVFKEAHKDRDNYDVDDQGDE